MSEVTFEVLSPRALERPGPDLIDAWIAAALVRVDRMLPQFDTHFPAPSSESNIYGPIDNVEWTNGFWTGMLWLSWEFTGADKYREIAVQNLASFANRIEKRINVDHHDLGFLYTLSSCAGYRLTGDRAARDAGIAAATQLLARFDPVAKVIQAWGDMNVPAERGRMIIDCNLNVPLLYWATRETGAPHFAAAADQHLEQAARLLVRPDASTFHTYYVDTVTGEPRHGSTHQGYSDDSSWARGQAWGIYGFALAWRHTGKQQYLDLASRLANHFLNRLPDDGICCWDLIFTQNEGVDRDSSAAAIAACGLLELAQALPLSDALRETYEAWAVAIMKTLSEDYLAPVDGSNALLLHGVYHMPNKAGVDEACIWGDYFYLEALMRLRRPWSPYWA
ncbi:glycoside hydrolase family 88 protein [Novosphingobium guangzhouense]|uniref:Glucuronyl hydrolase n=1 Tax=Novosphingobium guangzhouense TaxID=1850347 RepID=A0A2K2FWX7_9SPHN|nr:glycoside hydrolase family 88 protein [Novosphingobium guangzhouense]PNU03272.1 glucuronyl hydrolase [Novosphingobium guangzhouense]